MDAFLLSEARYSAVLGFKPRALHFSSVDEDSFKVTDEEYGEM